MSFKIYPTLVVACISSVFLSVNTLAAPPTQPAISVAEKPNLKIGFIKLTDMVPLAIAAEKGFFKDEGLNVQLEAQSNWKVLYDRLASGELDGAHMLAAMPLGSATGVTGQKEIIAPFTLSYNGAGITVSNEVWANMKANVPMVAGKPKHPISAAALAPVIANYKKSGKPFNLGMTFPVGTHNYLLRYWLAAGGVHPGMYNPQKGDNSGNTGGDVMLSVVPPPQMVATMQAGTTMGYSVGEPWNQQAVTKGIGVPVITSDKIWKDGADKVFGVTKQFADTNPKTTVKVVKALIRASYWLDEGNNVHRAEASKIISKPNYVGADSTVIDNSMTGTFEFEKGDVRAVPDFNKFFRGGQYGIPYYSDAIWWLTQMRRCGKLPQSNPYGWYMDMAKKSYRPQIYAQAAKELIAEGKMKATDFPNLNKNSFMKAPQVSPLDGIKFDGNKPNAYLASFKIGNK